MEMAEAGDRFVYASRATLPIASAGAKRMRDLAALNLVCLTRPRSKLDPTIFNYQATRTSAPVPLPEPKRPTLTAHLVDAEAAIVNALLPVLARAARFARPCPTDKQLAERTQLPIASIQPGLAALSAAGLIRIEALPAPTRRRVIIIATGAQTGLIA
jgi:hypothetical protein